MQNDKNLVPGESVHVIDVARGVENEHGTFDFELFGHKVARFTCKEDHSIVNLWPIAKVTKISDQLLSPNEDYAREEQRYRQRQEQQPR